MAANRKLQGEIDRTLKKVQEGVEVFDEIWDKVYNAQNQNQKEKCESELKSQIKKLQRYRDDIKAWITNSDIKDKRPLTDARKLIETEMERFKVCEKEFKTKAFSKEGLSQAPKEDPREKEKNKVRKWIAEKLDVLSSQIDAYEVEIESAATSSKKKKKNDMTSKWEELVERCRYHEEKLEVVLRLVDNETLSTDDIELIKDQLEYLLEQMVEGNTEEVDNIDDESIYEELGLDEHGAGGNDDHVPEPVESKPTPAKEEKLSAKERKAREKEERAQAEEKKERKKEKAIAAEPIALPSINAAAKAAPIPKAKPEPPAKVAAKAAPAVQPAVAAKAAAGRTPAQVPLTANPPARNGRAANLPGSSMLIGAQAGRKDELLTGGAAQPKVGGLPPPSGLGAMAGAPGGGLPTALESAEGGADSVFASLTPKPTGDDSDSSGRGMGASEGYELTPEEQQAIDEMAAIAGGALMGEDNTADHLLVLNSSLQNMPEPADSERPKSYVPRNPYPTPSSFPQTPAPVFDSPSVFDQFDTDTLFFIFYYQQGTYQQYLAARELKKQSWRYHKKYLTWFQRHEEPKVTADEYEQGTYVYFDYETGWCQRIKSDFTFEYGFLEDEMAV